MRPKKSVLWSLSCYFGHGVGLKNLFLFISLLLIRKLCTGSVIIDRGAPLGLDIATVPLL